MIGNWELGEMFVFFCINCLICKICFQLHLCDSEISCLLQVCSNG